MGRDDLRCCRTTLTTMKDDRMTLLRRTCSTCSSFAPNDGGCYNMLTFDGKAPLPGDDCGDHQTRREYNAEDRAITLFWKRLDLPRPNAHFGEGGVAV